MADLWHHRALSRVSAEEMLVASGQDGAFLIRNSDSVSNALVLCLMYQSRVHHYRIYLRSEKYSVQTVAGVSQVFCDTLADLVAYYSTPGAGLVHHLQYPVEREEEGDNESSDSDTEGSSGSLFKPHVRPPGPPPAPLTSNPTAMPRHTSSAPAASSYFDDGCSDYADVPGLVPSSATRTIGTFFETNLKGVDSTGVDEAFLDKVHTYATDSAVNDLEFVISHSDKPYVLQRMLMESGAEAFRQLQLYNRRLMFISDFFSRCSGSAGSAPHEREAVSAQGNVEWTEAIQRLATCQDLLTSIDTKAGSLMKTIASQYGFQPQQLQQQQQQQQQPPPPSKTLSQTTLSPPVGPSMRGRLSSSPDRVVETFETRTDNALKTKTLLTVDVDAGTLTIGRDKDSATFNYSQVVQIIKSRSAKQKLGILLDGKARKDVLFNDNKSREVFCQLMQLVQKRNSTAQDISNISLFIGTFNMGDAPCPNDLESWLRSKGQGKSLDSSLSQFPHDVYVIGTQESGAMGERDWKSVLYQYTGIEFKMVEQASLWGIRLVIMVKPEHYNKISHVQTSTVRTGVANTLGNKGAAAISMHFGVTSLCFICAHLTSGTEKCTRRNNNYRDILRGLTLGQRGLQQFDLTSQFHHVFWFGDLNYRLDCEDESGASMIVSNIKNGNLGVLHDMDQLRREQAMGHVFCSFEEEGLDFPPTYRYERGTREVYSWRKEKKMSVRINVPSWCDRVLWKSYPRTVLQNTSYGCTTDITISDHSPVFSTFNMGIITQFTSKGVAATNSSLYVHFTHAAAIISSSSRTNYYLEVHSDCLNSFSRSVSNAATLNSEQQQEIRKACPRVLRMQMQNTSFPEWTSTQLEKMSLQPILTDEDYLVNQHFFIAVKSSDGDEVYGGGVVAAVQFFSKSPVEFGIELTRHGKATGFLRGSMYIPMKTTRQDYDIVTLVHEEDLDRPTPLPALPPMPGSPVTGYGGVQKGGLGGPPLLPTDIESVRLNPVSLPRPALPPPTHPPPAHPPPAPMRRGPSSSMRARPTPAADANSADPPRVPMRPTRSRTATADSRDERPPVPHNKPGRAVSESGGLSPFPPLSSSPAHSGGSGSMSAMSRTASDGPPALPPQARGGSTAAPPPVRSPPAHQSVIRTRSAQVSGQPQPMSRPPRNSFPADAEAAHAGGDSGQSSVAVFLTGLGLSRYIDGFIEAGWDDVDFLVPMSISDLKRCGVSNVGHQRQLMDAVKQLGR